MAKVLLPEDLKDAAREHAAANVVEINPELAGLPVRQRRVIEILLKDPNLSFDKICQLAGYKPGNENNVKRAIGGKLAKSMRENGLFESDLIQCLLRQLNATKIVFATERERDSEGKIIRENIRALEIPDNSAQLTALKIAAHLGDYFPAKKIEGSLKTEHTGRVFLGVPVEDLEARRKQLEANGVKAEFEVVDDDDHGAADPEQEEERVA